MQVLGCADISALLHVYLCVFVDDGDSGHHGSHGKKGKFILFSYMNFVVLFYFIYFNVRNQGAEEGSYRQPEER